MLLRGCGFACHTPVENTVSVASSACLRTAQVFACKFVQACPLLSVSLSPETEGVMALLGVIDAEDR